MTRTVLAAALMLTTAVLLPGQQDAQAAYNKLAKEYGEAYSAWQTELDAKVEAAKKEGKRVPRSAYRPPSKEFVGTAQELAQEFAGKDDAIMFLGFIVKNGSSERNAIKWAVKTLETDHIESKKIGDVLPHLSRVARLASRNVRSLLNEVAENHADANCRAQALLVRGGMKLERGDESGGIADLKKVSSLTKDEDLLDSAKEALHEVQKLAIGATAPEINGVDVEGVEFKLSDYRGKVVLLDFWGFW